MSVAKPKKKWKTNKKSNAAYTKRKSKNAKSGKMKKMVWKHQGR
jgi:hypothetical protein